MSSNAATIRAQQTVAAVAMGYPYAFIGYPTPRGEQIAAGALERLGHHARYAQRDLQRLADAWFTPSSCFRTGREEHAVPTLGGIQLVLEYAHRNDERVALAALNALQSAAVVCARRVYDTLPESIWGVPGVAQALESYLSGGAMLRLGATRFASNYPDLRLVTKLQTHLRDSIYTVRWRCVSALAQLSHFDGLVEVMVASAPRNIDLSMENYGLATAPRSWAANDFFDALRRLGPLGEQVVGQLGLRRAKEPL